MNQYLRTLGLKEGASEKEIKEAYRKLALKFHPDKNPNDPFFEKMFRDVQNAYEKLRDGSLAETRKTRTGKESSSSSPKRWESNQGVLKDVFTKLEAHNELIDKNPFKKETKISCKSLVSFISERRLTSVAVSKYSEKSTAQFIRHISKCISVLEKTDRKKAYRQIEQELEGSKRFLELFATLSYSHVMQYDRSKNKRSDIRQWVYGLVLIFIMAGLGYFLRQKNQAKYNVDKPEQNVSTLEGALPERKLPSLLEPKRKEKPINQTPKLKTIDPSKYSIAKEVSESRWVGNSLHTGDSPFDGFFGKGVYSDSYYNEVKFKNGQELDVVVCLVMNNYPNRTIRNEYIRAGENFTMSKIPNGTYFIKSFYGKSWNPDTVVIPGVNGFFEEKVSFDKSDSRDDLIVMSQKENSQGTQYSSFEITLFAVLNGNLETKDIPADEFFEK